MSISIEDKVISNLQKHFGVSLYTVRNKKIFYTGDLPDGGEILICTPKSKLQPKGNGWVDLTVKQITLLQKATYAVFAIRLESDKTYYLGLDDLKPLLTEDAMIYNDHEGDHWKLHIWPDHIKVLGNHKTLDIIPNNINKLDTGKK